MTEEQKQRMFLNWHNQWIVPELERRHGKDNIPEDTKVTECLVLLPKGQTPIVKFNGEFGWRLPSMLNLLLAVYDLSFK